MPVLCINILSGKEHNIVEEHFYNHYSLSNNETHTKLTNKLSIHYSELGKFKQELIQDDLQNNWGSSCYHFAINAIIRRKLAELKKSIQSYNPSSGLEIS